MKLPQFHAGGKEKIPSPGTGRGCDLVFRRPFSWLCGALLREAKKTPDAKKTPGVISAKHPEGSSGGNDTGILC